MKLVTFLHRSSRKIGILDGERVYAASWPGDMLGLIQRGITPDQIAEYYPLDEVKLDAPLRPGKIIAIGRNYKEHAEEYGNELPPAPLIFAKFPSSVIGSGDTITWSKSITNSVDWEVELGVIIGRKARNVKEQDALNHVFGYTVGNDVSARDIQLKQDTQWTRGKSLDTFCPLGPCIVTSGEIRDPHNLTLMTKVNDEVMQNGSTRMMIFNVAYLIAYCSRMFTLEPGDLILTGTPSGVGGAMNPPRFLKDGDVVKVSIEGIGELVNPCAELD